MVSLDDQAGRAARFLELHVPGNPLIMPNAWDCGSAKVLASLGFKALSTANGGLAATLGRRDGHTSIAESIAHAETVVAASDLPVSADLEHGFAETPAGVADSVRRALAVGVTGCSIEDHLPGDPAPACPLAVARDRISAAADAAHPQGMQLVLTARAENYLYDRTDIKDTIARLQAYQEAGADVLYAPGMRSLADVRALVSSVDRPVNVLIVPGGPRIAELAEAGVARVSVGSTYWIALGALKRAASELIDGDTRTLLSDATRGAEIARSAFA